MGDAHADDDRRKGSNHQPTWKLVSSHMVLFIFMPFSAYAIDLYDILYLDRPCYAGH
jgi:hypothetical protein